MSRRNRWLGAPLGIGLALAMTSYAFAYVPQVPHTITVTPSSATILCEHPDAVFATVLDQDALPIKGVIVTWSFTVSPSSGDRILQATSKTNKDGVARTMVKAHMRGRRPDHHGDGWRDKRIRGRPCRCQPPWQGTSRGPGRGSETIGKRALGDHAAVRRDIAGRPADRRRPDHPRPAGRRNIAGAARSRSPLTPGRHNGL